MIPKMVWPLVCIQERYFNFTTLIKPLDELGELSNVPFFVTTHVFNNSLPTVLVDPNSVYTAGYLQFQASDDVEKGHGNITTAVELQTVSEPALLLSFNVTLLECPPPRIQSHFP